jgi:hypothetical protein
MLLRWNALCSFRILVRRWGARVVLGRMAGARNMGVGYRDARMSNRGDHAS